MTPDPHLLEDPVIRRLAAVAPEFAPAQLSPTTPRARATAERIIASDRSAPGSRRGRDTRLRGISTARRVPALLAAAVTVLVIALGLAAVLSGPDGSGTQSASAAIVHRIERALGAESGEIVVMRQTLSDSAFNGHPATHTDIYSVAEGFAGTGQPQNSLLISPQLGTRASSDGTDEIYVPATNTIYLTNGWAAYIHPGPTPGTYVYRPTQGAPVPARGLVLPLTAAQAHALEHGAATLNHVRTADGHGRWMVVPNQSTSENVGATIRGELTHHTLRYDGEVTLAGHRAYRLAGVPASSGLTLYVDARTYLPLKQVLRSPEPTGPAAVLTQTWSEWRTLPVTPQNLALLNLRARHPTARIDRNRADYLREARRLGRH